MAGLLLLTTPLGACGPAAPVPTLQCVPNACQQSATLNSRGECIYTPKADGTSCDDGNPCTVFDSCKAGICSPGTRLADGAACDDDNVCTQTDSCQSGVCIGSDPLVCPVTSLCQQYTTCDPKLGCVSADVGPCSQSLNALPLTGCTFYTYTAPVTIGATRFDLLVDSGSSTTAVAAQACSSCTGLSPLYTGSGNGTGVSQNATTSGSYGDGSGWNAAVYVDKINAGLPQDSNYGTPVRMALASITQQANNFFSGSACGGVDNVNAYQGIWGLGPIGGASASTSAYMDVAAAQGNLFANAFATQLCNLGGRMWLGGYDPRSVSGAVKFTPLLDGTNDALHYSIAIQDIRLGNTSLNVSSYAYGAAVVDTATGVLMLPQVAYDALKTQLSSNADVKAVLDPRTLTGDTSAQRLGYPALNNRTPDEVDALLPKFTIWLPGGGSASNNALQMAATKSYLSANKRTTNGVLQYVYTFTAYPSDTTILGAAVLKSHVFIFDRENSRLGFAPQASFCSVDVPTTN